LRSSNDDRVGIAPYPPQAHVHHSHRTRLALRNGFGKRSVDRQRQLEGKGWFLRSGRLLARL
jgi:hypothetical protein